VTLALTLLRALQPVNAALIFLSRRTGLLIVAPAGIALGILAAIRFNPKGENR
jgi:hypothetical protein